MAFNHYAKMKRILASYGNSWYIRRINQSTKTTKFNGETVMYDYFYRVYDINDRPIPFCKFQQLERFSRTMNIPFEDLPIIDNGDIQIGWSGQTLQS